MGAFSTALSALDADSSAIDIVGNNLANLNTTGFKESDIDFSDIMAQQLGTGTNNGQLGMGVGPVTSVQDFSQGTITSTGGALDSAIEGNGFFVVTDSNGNQLYTRDGSFQLSSTGQLLTATGQNVQGWTAVNGVVNTNGAVGNLTVPVDSTIAPTATQNMSMNINLDSSTAVNGTYSAPITVYDSLGQAQTLTATFTETSANNWSYNITIPTSALSTTSSLYPAATTNADGSTSEPTTASVATGTLTFGSDGILTAVTPSSGSSGTSAISPVALSIDGLADGASTATINWNPSNSAGTPLITQYAQTSSMSNPTQDGSAAGQVSGVSIQNGGLVVANYSNGQTLTLGQLAVANIANPTSLLQVGDNNLQASATSAQAAIGASGTGGLGTIEGGSLEASNTNMAAEFTQLLSYERSYQAASRVITTADTLMQEAVNLVHS